MDNNNYNVENPKQVSETKIYNIYAITYLNNDAKSFPQIARDAISIVKQAARKEKNCNAYLSFVCDRRLS